MSEKLNQCGCCEGVEPQTPASVENRAGLSSLAARVGTHGRFKTSMQAALSAHEATRALTTRADEDPANAMLDAWATVLDVLAFYQERIANEGYLRTATERRSVLDLARAVGYELGPGVAAGTFLSFAMETATGAPASAIVGAGTQAQSLPGQDEAPQTFETTEEIEARGVWNAMPARPAQPVTPGFGTTAVYLTGVDNNLTEGDALVFVGEERENDSGNENWDFRRINAIELDRERELTHVELDRGLGSFTPFVRPAANARVYAMRGRAALFGHNAPDWLAMPDSIKDTYDPGRTNPDPNRSEWPDLTITDIADGRADTVYLDAVYPKIVLGSWVVLANDFEYAELYRVTSVVEDARTGFTLSGKCTRLEIEGENLVEEFDDRVRETVVFTLSERLALAETPITTPVGGTLIDLAELVDGLQEDQLIAVSGLDASGDGSISEVATLKRARTIDTVVALNASESLRQTTRLEFTDPLVHSYARDSVVVTANVARSTHGETKAEVLGSGDGSRAFQRFTLKQNPLTYVSAATASGVETTLEIRVDGVRWDEARSLYDVGPQTRAYIVRIADDDSVTVQFGDGHFGARLPTGTENVQASYRMGTGLDGLVEADQISLLKTRPLGVKSVANPLAPTGAADPETLDEARVNAPLTVLTLDRIVSVQDFEDFARAFAGIGKAQATLLWSGERQIVHLTVAGAEGGEVPVGSALRNNLLAAIDAARHAEEPIGLDTYLPLPFGLTARILVDENLDSDVVLEAVRAALVRAFSFERRAFGQAVTASEVLAAIQSVTGVVAADLDELGGVDAVINPRLPASIARWSGDAIQPAQLLTVDPEGILLETMTP